MAGGARPGAGRKSIAEENKTRELCKAAIVGKYGSVENGLMKLLESGEPSLMKFVYEHAIGKPTENVNLDIPESVKSFTINAASRKRDRGK